MRNKNSSHRFADLIPTGIVALFCGIVAISVLIPNLYIACLVGTIGIKLGVTALKMQLEKLDKINAMIGISLSIIPLIYALVIFTYK